MSSPIILMVYVGFLFVGLFFILKNVVRLYKEVAKAEELLSAANQEAVEAKRQIDQLKIDAERWKVDLEQKSAEVARKDAEVVRSAGEAKRCVIELQVKTNELMIKEQEAQQLMAEIEGFKNRQKVEAVRAAQYKDSDERLVRLKSEAVQKDQELQALKAELARAQAGQSESLGKAEEVNKLKSELERFKLEVSKLQADQSDSAGKVEELNKLKGELAAKAALLAENEKEVVRLNGECRRLDGEFQQAVSATAKFKAELEGKAGEVERLRSAYQGYDERVAKLRTTEDEISRLEKSLEDEKRALRNVRMRAQESKMKLDLLGEKTKESVEAIAQFAAGKEFDEFRKSVHMDETIRKYEDEIKHLKIQIIELEKKG